ncbi:MAG TPA: MFS transporter [Longimicrobiales bacterium]
MSDAPPPRLDLDAADGPRRRDGRAPLPAAFWYLWTGTLINRIGGLVIPFLTLFLTGRRGLSVSQATLVIALWGGAQLAGSVAGGHAADRIGRRATLLVSLLGGAAVMVIIPFLRGYLPLAGAVAAVGFMGGLYRPAVGAAVADLVPEPHRAHAYALIYWATNLGFAIAPVMAGLLAERWFTGLFVVDAATSAAFGLLAFARVPETRPLPEVATSPGVPVVATARDRSGWHHALADPALMLFAAGTFLTNAVALQAFTTLPLAMRAHGLSPRDFGLVIATNGVLIVLLILPAGRQLARLPAATVLAAGALLNGVGFGLVALVTTRVGYAATVLVWTLGEIVMVPTAGALTARLAPIRLRGTYQGVVHGAGAAAALVGPLAGGVLLQRAGEPVLWATCLGVGVAAGAGFAGLSWIRDRAPGDVLPYLAGQSATPTRMDPP